MPEEKEQPKTETSPDSPYAPYEGDLSNNEKMRLAYEQYEASLRAIEDGTFPVKKGTHVFRVINGLKVGRSSAGVKVGEQVENNYATPHVESVEAIMSSNDMDQMYYDGSPFDMYQKVAVIEVADFEIPKPDLTHGLVGDKDQVIVKGEVKEILSPQVFLDKYKNMENDQE